MKHTSVLKLNSPIEFIESSKISPFISKVQIKVCYVGDKPNRNRSIITKDVAREMAPSLRGCPIVGFYNENVEDYEEHNKQINISNGEWKLTDSTVPYGFVDLNAKIWFATYIDDNQNEHEYLCTEGYVWDHVYPEAERIITKGNNQSMELDEGTLDATWSKDKNGNPEFFIINEALFSKLCILGEDCEPCFEGSQITNFSLTIDESFQQKMFTMMNEIKDLLKGGTKVFNTYAVEIGDTLWSALYNYVQNIYPDDTNHPWGSKYSIDGIFEENGQKFAVLCDRNDMKYYRLNFSLSEADGFSAEDNLVEVTKSYTEVAGKQFSPEAVEAYVKKKEEEDKNKGKDDEEDKKDSEDNSEEDEKKDSEDEDEEDEKKKKKFSYDSLEEIPEYNELQANYAALQSQVTELNSSIKSLTAELTSLREFKIEAERTKKEEKIAEFYMLSDEDKKDVLDNIDKYSLEDIESKLAVIGFRNKVSFKTESENERDFNNQTTYRLGEDEGANSSIPAWVQAALDTAKTLN